MLDRYINWDKAAIEMIRRHQDAIYALDALRDEKDALNANIGNIGAMDYERPRVASSGGDAQDTIVNRLLRMDTIDTRIQALEREMQAYDRAWSQLSETERAVLHEFFQCGNRPSQRAVCDMRKHLDAMWNRVRDNNATAARAKLLQQATINVACEAIQVAAMARKFIDMEASKCD